MSDITIGCDPEFGFLSTKTGNKVLPPSGLNQEMEFGIDGCSRICELRPAPAKDPRELVKTIGKTLYSGYKEYSGHRKYHWKAGGMCDDEPLGGHIHLGHNDLKRPDNARQVATMLDTVVAPMVLLVEDQDEAIARRIGTSYGQIGASYRDQPRHGMEWRPLPSWLSSPEDAVSILSLTYVVASEYNNNDFKNLVQQLPLFDQDTYNACDKPGIIYYIPEILKCLKKAKLYKKYKDEIGILIDKIIKQDVMSTESMVDAWSLPALLKKEQPVEVTL